MSTMSASPRPLTPFPHTHTLYHGQHASYFHHIPFEAQPHAQYASRPIHFQVSPMPSPTPPSLVGKGSHVSRTPSFTRKNNSPRAGPSTPAAASTSTAASASGSASSATHILAPSPRRMSSSTSTSTSSSSDYSMASPPMPTTPHLDSAFIHPSPATTPFSLPPPAYSHQQKRSSSPFEPIIEVPTPFNDAPTPARSSSSELERARDSSKFSYDPYSSYLATGEPIATGYLPSLSPSATKRPKFKRRDTPIPHVHSFAQLIRMRTGVDEENESRVLRSVIDGGAWVIV
ncbi:hypothetical protein I317_05883 [Kwoniella heveanensis CBS 569]|uniref:Uncharacterized protein n=1 Tax=Kwoniella heveanensis BCC8398 TaxID=1296120 RepID=A0A1B9H0J9_9TREE|nr:hypothetical protein I316_01376 [Kwoniella heveanensis BCC8398]OCF40316.1 hypothetical protein I317_05883 [Kwoniella heveanensis CBS 569]